MSASIDVPKLDGSALIPAAHMRPFNWRGQVANNTTYNPWDVVQLGPGGGNRLVLITGAVTSSGTGFISAAKYDPLQGYTSWINVKDYGAKGDAATDDTAAIQAAIDAATASAASTSGGGTVFFPAGIYNTSATLILKKHVWLRGEGMIGSVIKLAVNANCDVVKTFAAATGSGTNADFGGLVDISLDGNKANQSGAGPYHGFVAVTNPLTTTATGDSFFDMHHLLQNVRVYKAKGDGFHLTGRSAIQLVNCFAQACDQYGFFSTFDTNFTHCESDSAGWAGFYLNNGSIRASVCKAYLSGQNDQTNGAGFRIDSNANGITLAACEAQNNYGPGYLLNGCNRVNIQGISDSNNFNVANSYAGVELAASSYNRLNIVCWQGVQGGSQVGHQDSALRVTGASNFNDIALSHSAQSPATIGVAVTADSIAWSSTTSNRVWINGGNIWPLLEAQANKGQPNGYAPLDGSGLVPTSNLPASSVAANFAAGFFGDGSDGAVNLDGTNTFAGFATKAGNTYTLTRNVFATTLTVGSGVTLISKGFIVYASTAVTGTGVIQFDGFSATSATGGFAAIIAGGSSVLGSTAGGAGGTAAGTAGTNNTNQTIGTAGGAGGAGASGAGGAAGTVVAPISSVVTAPRTLPWAAQGSAMSAGAAIAMFAGGSGGGGGGGDGTNSGGGGGGAGGVVLVNARAVTGTLTFRANGGNGFTPTTGNCGGGGGGGGGAVIVNCTTASGTTLLANGGTQGSGVGTGSAGTAGTAGKTFLNVWS